MPNQRFSLAAATAPHARWVGRLSVLLALFVLLSGTARFAPVPAMRVFCINVGQADCTLLEFPGGAVLIDAGADAEHRGEAKAFLQKFFARRTDLHNTLESIIVTHSHIDHTVELQSLIEGFTVRRVIDNGNRNSSGRAYMRWVEQAGVPQHNVRLIAVPQQKVEAAHAGHTDADIDPFPMLDGVDPQIHILSASRDENPGWPSGVFDNENNHSLVVRVDFGQASLLFTGDMEEDALETLVDDYASNRRLDVDVYHVGHHGSHNATTDELLQAMSPQIAVISMGPWDFGRGSKGRFTTFAYGHPRILTLDRLQAAIPGFRSKPVEIRAAKGARDFRDYSVKKRVYATGWDGSIEINATADRRYRTTVNGN